MMESGFELKSIWLTLLHFVKYKPIFKTHCEWAIDCNSDFGSIPDFSPDFYA